MTPNVLSHSISTDDHTVTVSVINSSQGHQENHFGYMTRKVTEYSYTCQRLNQVEKLEFLLKFVLASTTLTSFDHYHAILCEVENYAGRMGFFQNIEEEGNTFVDPEQNLFQEFKTNCLSFFLKVKEVEFIESPNFFEAIVPSLGIHISFFPKTSIYKVILKDSKGIPTLTLYYEYWEKLQESLEAYLKIPTTKGKFQKNYDNPKQPPNKKDGYFTFQQLCRKSIPNASLSFRKVPFLGHFECNIEGLVERICYCPVDQLYFCRDSLTNEIFLTSRSLANVVASLFN